jgi:glycerol-3-phosphate cytidylyltransferase
MIYCFDLDGTICSSVENSQYHLATPDKFVVNKINELYDNGNQIIIMTARGSISKIDHTDITKSQLDVWGVKHHKLIMNKKPFAHYYIDDRAVHIDDWKKSVRPKKNGIIAGAFDVIHPGYVKMFQEAKNKCDHLTVALHIDPSIERGKMKPVHTWAERAEVLLALKYIDDINIYEYEWELEKMLSSGHYDIRFLGEDYLNKEHYTGKDLSLEIGWINRNHGYSTTNFKNKIINSVINNEN